MSAGSAAVAAARAAGPALSRQSLAPASATLPPGSAETPSGRYPPHPALARPRATGWGLKVGRWLVIYPQPPPPAQAAWSCRTRPVHRPASVPPGARRPAVRTAAAVPPGRTALGADTAWLLATVGLEHPGRDGGRRSAAARGRPAEQC